MENTIFKTYDDRRETTLLTNTLKKTAQKQSKISNIFYQ